MRKRYGKSQIALFCDFLLMAVTQSGVTTSTLETQIGLTKESTAPNFLMSDPCCVTLFVLPYFFLPTYMTAFFKSMLGQFRLPHQTLPMAVYSIARTPSGQAVTPEQHLPKSQTVLHTDSRPACSFPQMATFILQNYPNIRKASSGSQVLCYIPDVTCLTLIVLMWRIG